MAKRIAMVADCLFVHHLTAERCTAQVKEVIEDLGEYLETLKRLEEWALDHVEQCYHHEVNIATIYYDTDDPISYTEYDIESIPNLRLKRWVS